MSPHQIPGKLLLILLGCFIAPTAAAQAPDFSEWDLHAARAEPVTHLGRSALQITGGTAFLPDTQLQDGTIEVDIAPSDGFVFAGLVFRALGDDDAEEVYLRLNKSGLPDAVQYAPRRRGLTAWQFYSGDGFTAPARFSTTDWIRLRIEVAGYEARVFVDDAEVLTAPLQRESRAGAVGLWGLGGATFSNVRVRPAAASPSDRAVGVAPDGFLADWEISRVFPADSVDTEAYPESDLPMDWRPLAADATGLVDVSRLRHIAEAGGGEGLVYARAVLTAEGSERRKLSFGYSDEVTVFLNGQPLFTGNSRWRARDPLFLGTIGLHDHLYLDLAEGENELVFALTEWFGGWGLMARAEPVPAHRPLSLGQLLERNAEAMGGRTRLDTLRSVVTLRNNSLFSLKLPHSVLVEGFDSTGTLTYAEGYNGVAAWEQTRQDSARRAVTGGPEVALRRVAQWPGNLLPLYRMEEFGHALSLEGTETIGGTPYYRLQLTLSDGFQRRYYVNAETFRIERARDTRELHASDGDTRDIETVFTDYREVDGYWFPFTVVERDLHTGEQLYSRTMTAIFPNASVPDRLFDPRGESDFARVEAFRKRAEQER